MAIDFPNSPTNGDIFTSNGRSWSYDTGVWSLISSQVVGGDFGTVVDAKGDLIVGTADNVVSRLAAGTNEHRLVADSAQAGGLKYVADTTNYAVSAKGDLLVGTAADTVARVGVGANGTALVADSAEVPGVKWAAVGDVTLTDNQTLLNKTITGPLLNQPILYGAKERWSASTGSIPSSLNVDVLNGNTAFIYTGAAAADWTLNIRGDSSTSLSGALNTGDSVTIALAVWMTTARYQTSLSINGSVVTPEWQGGTVPTSGNANSYDVYVFTVVRTQASPPGYVVFASRTQFT